MGDCISQGNAQKPLDYHRQTQQNGTVSKPTEAIKGRHQDDHQIFESQARKNLATLKQSIFLKTLQQQLEVINQTEENLFDIIGIIDHFASCLLQNKLTEQQKNEIEQFIQTKSLETLTYPELIESWEQNHEIVKFATKSTLFHHLSFRKQNLKVPLEDFNELIQLQGLEQQTEKLATNFESRMKEMKNEKQNIQRMIEQCGNHVTMLRNLSYSIELQQIKTIGSISKSIAGQYDQGIYVLLQYFMKAIQIQSMNTDFRVIQEKIIKAIGYLMEEQSNDCNSDQIERIKSKSCLKNFYNKLKQIDCKSVIQGIENMYREQSRNIKQNIEIMMGNPAIENEKKSAIRLFFEVGGPSKTYKFEQISIKFKQLPSQKVVNVIKEYDYVLAAIFKRKLATINVSLLQKLDEDRYINNRQFSKMHLQMFNLQFFKADQPINLYRTIEHSYEESIYDEYSEVFGVDELISSKAIIKRQQLEYLCNKSGQELEKSPSDKIIEIYGQQSLEQSKYLIQESKILQYRQEFDKSMQNSQKVFRNYSIIQGDSQKEQQMFDLLSYAYFITLQNHFIQPNLAEASQVLTNITSLFDQSTNNQLYQLFTILKAQYQLYSNNNFEQFMKSHQQITHILEKEIRQNVLVHQFVTDAQWRIGQFLIKLGEEQLNQQVTRHGFHYYLIKALYSYSDQIPQDFLKKLNQVKAFELEHRFPQQRLRFKYNEKIKIFGALTQQPNIFFIYLSRTNWPNLQKLYLGDNTLHKQHFETLGSGLLNLTCLQLNNNQISIAGYEGLVKQPWVHLSKLFLNDNNIEGQELKFLIKGEWPCLEVLSLANNRIGDECFLLTQSNWPKLNSLNLKNNEITDIGVQNICKASHNLQILQLQENQISSYGCQFFINNKSNIKMLCLRDNMLDDLGLSQLQDSLPGTVIDTVI